MLIDNVTKIDVPTDKYTGFYRGVVVDTNDPKEAGRVRVRVHPAFTEVDDDVLPWASSAAPILLDMTATKGLVGIPTVGSWVWCFFEAGSIYAPVYFAYAPAMIDEVPVGSKRGRGERDEVDDTIEGDLQEAETNTHGTWKEEETRDTVYGKDTVIETESGLMVELDDSPDNKRIFVYHPSGSYVCIQDDGTIHLHSVKETVQVTKEDSKILVQGNSLQTVEQDLDVKVQMNIGMKSSAGTLLESDATTTVKSSVIDIQSTGMTSISGSIVRIN